MQKHKERIHLTLSPEACERLDILEKNAFKIYGKNICKSMIIQTLIMNTRDRLQIIKDEKREIMKTYNLLDEEEKSILEERQALMSISLTERVINGNQNG